MITVTEKLAQTIKKLYNVEIGEKELEMLYQGQSLAEVLGITKSQVDQFERLGIDKLEQKNYQDAYDISIFLISLQPEVPRFYVSAGHAMQYMQQFETALQHYLLAIQMDVDYLPAYLGAALSYFFMGNIESANDTLASGLIIAVDNDNEEGINDINNLYREINGGDNE